MKILAENKKVGFDYQILERFEGGLVLTGQEVKSIRTGKVSLKGAFVVFKGEEPYLINATIPPYQPKNAPKDYDPERTRKVLLKKKEIKYLLGKSKEKGLTLIPLMLYDRSGKIKVEIVLAKGKKKEDKREEIKKREVEREIRRFLKRG
ncbi:MAG: SsrA-binding protein SmpB [Candidatus Pacebacteria bacterium]|nr:SsrA-binding protein SmpB [Candidatus Paceibacterota bacterium]